MVERPELTWWWLPKAYGGQHAEKGGATEGGPFRQYSSVPVLLRLTQSRGKGIMAAIGAFVIFGRTPSGGVESRISKGSHVFCWEAVQVAQAMQN